MKVPNRVLRLRKKIWGNQIAAYMLSRRVATCLLTDVCHELKGGWKFPALRIHNFVQASQVINAQSQTPDKRGWHFKLQEVGHGNIRITATPKTFSLMEDRNMYKVILAADPSLRRDLHTRVSFLRNIQGDRSSELTFTVSRRNNSSKRRSTVRRARVIPRRRGTTSDSARKLPRVVSGAKRVRATDDESDQSQDSEQRSAITSSSSLRRTKRLRSHISQTGVQLRDMFPATPQQVYPRPEGDVGAPTMGEDLADTLHMQALGSLTGQSEKDSSKALVYSANMFGRYHQPCTHSGRLGIIPESEQVLRLNVEQPFCMVVCGVQGSGKSHTVNTVVETCMLKGMAPAVQMDTAMAGLVMHYGRNPSAACEVVGCADPTENHDIVEHYSRMYGRAPPCINNMTILVSPNNYAARKRFYEGCNCEVVPLLFRWSTLTAEDLMAFMCVKEGNNIPLCWNLIMKQLQLWQRTSMPSYSSFKRWMNATITEKKWHKGQVISMQQRLELLESMVIEARVNSEYSSMYTDFTSLVKGGRLIVADMTDPLLLPANANGIFRVLLDRFRCTPTPGCGKLAVFDEAHRYLQPNGGEHDPMTQSVVNAIRNMRHEGMRVVISTQSPLAIPPEALSLVSIAMLHRIHSRDWYTHVTDKLPFPTRDFDTVTDLMPGEATMFCANANVNPEDLKHVQSSDEKTSYETYGALTHIKGAKIKIRMRYTRDFGVSRQHGSPAERKCTDTTATSVSEDASDSEISLGATSETSTCVMSEGEVTEVDEGTPTSASVAQQLSEEDLIDYDTPASAVSDPSRSNSRPPSAHTHSVIQTHADRRVTRSVTRRTYALTVANDASEPNTCAALRADQQSTKS